MNGLLVRFSQNESGATAIEYSVIAGGISLVIVGVISAVGGKVSTMLTTLSNLFG